jgi:UDP-N-acetylglucosamine--N-acetylmuramyl-(pentapeptide) pyrophosphoryl-undecaprenol N-acetylglucosamine transferase
LIPYPYATDNHQEFNARSLTDNGGGVLMLDSDLKQDPGILRSTVDFLMENPEKLNNMKAAASKKAIPQSDVLFYKEMKKIIRSGKDGR